MQSVYVYDLTSQLQIALVYMFVYVLKTIVSIANSIGSLRKYNLFRGAHQVYKSTALQSALWSIILLKTTPYGV